MIVAGVPDIFLNIFLTIALEFPIFLIGSGKSVRTVASTCILINLLTLPFGTFMFRTILPNLFIVESLIVITEGFLFAWMVELPYIRSFPLSLVANGITALIGFVLYSSP